jgi:hypothetical protein
MRRRLITLCQFNLDLFIVDLGENSGSSTALSGERNPEFGTILKMLKALGLELHTTVAAT